MFKKLYPNFIRPKEYRLEIKYIKSTRRKAQEALNYLGIEEAENIIKEAYNGLPQKIDSEIKILWNSLLK